MRAIVLSLLIACGPKKAPEPAAAEQPAPAQPAAEQPAPAEAEEEPAAEEAEETAAEEAAEPQEVVNADLQVTVRRAGGETLSGHVKRIERSVDWFADEGWTTEPAKLVIEGENSTGARDIPWTDVKSVTIKPGKVPADVDCYYDSDWTPWMYDCTLKTTARVTLKDGTSWEVTNRHKWRFTFDDDSSVEFWLWKHPAREQDSESVDLDTENPENYDLYTKLQQRLRDEAAHSMVVAITVQ